MQSTGLIEQPGEGEAAKAIGGGTELYGLFFSFL